MGSPSRFEARRGSLPEFTFEAPFMYLTAARSVTLYEGLLRIDQDLALEAQKAGCPRCGGPLDHSPWLRKPRGVDLPDEFCLRLGLCCRSCRRRVLPASTLFWGRKVYWGAVVHVCVLVKQRRLVGSTATALREMFGVSVETLRRWIRMFQVEVPISERWRRLRGRVRAEVRDDTLPGGLLALFEQDHAPGEAALAALLAFWVGHGFGAF